VTAQRAAEDIITKRNVKRETDGRGMRLAATTGEYIYTLFSILSVLEIYTPGSGEVRGSIDGDGEHVMCTKYSPVEPSAARGKVDGTCLSGPIITAAS
jgi:hypothetical protein